MSKFIDNKKKSILTRPILFIIDSPMNALIASIIGKFSTEVSIIYAFDPERKDIEQYKKTLKDILHNLKIKSEMDIEFDSQKFWGGKKNDLLPSIRNQLKIFFNDKKDGNWLFFGNCMTNPVALATKRFYSLNHLYHAPGDFIHLLFPYENKFKSFFKNIVKKILKREIYKIEKSELPIISLLNFKNISNFQYIDYRLFESKIVMKKLNKLRRIIKKPGNKVLLLLVGDEPEPGDKNYSNINKYLKPHLDTLSHLINKKHLLNPTVWIKEHKSYFPLTKKERNLLIASFNTLNCNSKFIADYMPKSYKNLPGECILKYCNFDFIIAEPSAFLFNVSGTKIFPIAALSQFQNYRNSDQISRNEEFIKINSLLLNKVEVI